MPNPTPAAVSKLLGKIVEGDRWRPGLEATQQQTHRTWQDFSRTLAGKSEANWGKLKGEIGKSGIADVLVMHYSWDFAIGVAAQSIPYYKMRRLVRMTLSAPAHRATEEASLRTLPPLQCMGRQNEAPLRTLTPPEFGRPSS